MELNREQIIKALECCHSSFIADCKQCPYKGRADCEEDLGITCLNVLLKDALALIKELTEENERLSEKGQWIVTDADSGSFGEYEPFIEFKCPKCNSDYGIESGQYDWQYGEPIPWVACPLCGAKMKGE